MRVSLTTVDNPRGFAFVAFDRTYSRIHSWGWGAALAKAGVMPTRKEFIAEGLDMWDAMYRDGGDHIATTNEIARALSEGLRANCSGLMHYAKDNTVQVRMVSTDFSDWVTVGMVDDGYAQVDTALEFAARMRELIPHLSPSEAEVVAVLMGGLPDILTNIEIAEALGQTRQAIQSTWRRIRNRAAKVSELRSMGML